MYIQYMHPALLLSGNARTNYGAAEAAASFLARTSYHTTASSGWTSLCAHRRTPYHQLRSAPQWRQRAKAQKRSEHGSW